MKTKKYHTVRTVLKYNIKIVERGKIDTINTQIHDRSLSWLDTPNTQIHDRSLSWLDTPNIQIHDRSLSWLDTPNIQIHDRSLSWLDTPNTQIHDRSLSWPSTGTSIERFLGMECTLACESWSELLDYCYRKIYMNFI